MLRRRARRLRGNRGPARALIALSPPGRMPPKLEGISSLSFSIADASATAMIRQVSCQIAADLARRPVLDGISPWKGSSHRPSATSG
jgi:hypothetical protein